MNRGVAVNLFSLFSFIEHCVALKGPLRIPDWNSFCLSGVDLEREVSRPPSPSEVPGGGLGSSLVLVSCLQRWRLTQLSSLKAFVLTVLSA